MRFFSLGAMAFFCLFIANANARAGTSNDDGQSSRDVLYPTPDGTCQWICTFVDGSAFPPQWDNANDKCPEDSLCPVPSDLACTYQNVGSARRTSCSGT